MTNAPSAGKPIDRLSVAELNREEFNRKYRVPGKPLVITDFLAETVDWDLDFLCKHLDGRKFQVRDYGSGHFDAPRREWTKYCDHIQMTMGDFAAHLRDGSAKSRNLYLAQNPIGDSEAVKTIADEMRFLTETLGFEPIIPEASLNLWLGASGHVEPMHFDPGDGTLIMMHGEKRVVLYPPKQSKHLYPFGFYDVLPFWVSQVNSLAPDLDAYPDFSKAAADRFEVVLSPGQLLFIPTQWWHEVIAQGEGYVCSCNHFWKVKPWRRRFQTIRGFVIQAMNLFPWRWVLRFNRFIYQFKKS
ncbi:MULTISPECIES: cupin-like domain-containing protein [Methylomonas]|uniref:JmjC domain-containing protein n=1 Tax=Methylomonas koyamae TaxID=702114 RepID=A0A177N3Z4_9GAMM|nr:MULTISPECIES: cupin-like domain-containing protein [Methylomonas]NJA08167.1 cupin-like domain-containing protein [Methylococcaceae bacterium WWC4]OAI12581.1 hypothetical protein A1355_14295 [Methylomonas koyamae]OHX36725.1 hypothetical protein BJL95_04275 [Methylomonas sp. LWB]WGS85502.1 cupin-like domain-containing protein [Methylomonas sp. UP202]